MAITVKETIRRNGYIATPRRARKPYHTCVVCKGAITQGSEFYAIVKGGGGLGWTCHPDRVHPGCLDEYFNNAVESVRFCQVSLKL